MHGFFGPLSGAPRAGPWDLHWRDLHFSTTGKVFESGSTRLAIEGCLTRFVNSPIRLRRENPIESVLALYKEHGEDFVSRLDGLFLLIFSPSEESEIYIVNNRYQATRLYYTRTPAGLFVSQSIQKLLEQSGIDRKPCFGSIRAFLANGFTTSDETQIKGVHKFLPSDYFVLNRGQAERKSYWLGEMKFDRRPFENLEQHLDEYERLYRAGLERYLEARRPNEVGTLLSGGHDTSFVVAQSTQVLKSQLHCYTVTFPGWTFDEGKFAENIARKFNTKYHAIPFHEGHVDRIVSLIRANEEPVVGSSLPLHVLSEEASKTVDVMLGGDGGDTLWGEYYPVAEYHRWVHRLPTSIRRVLHKLALQLRDWTDWERFWELEHVAALFTEDNYHDSFMRKLCTYRHFNEAFQRELLTSQILKEDYSRSHTEIRFTDENFADALIEGKLFNAFYTYQSFHTTKSVEYFGMDLYLPTIEKDVIDFICSLPMEWVNGGTTFHRLTNNKKINRRFHKKALSRYLSREEIYNRSFDIPWYNILRPRRALLEKLHARLKARGWYNEAALSRLFSEFMVQKVKKHELLELKHHGYRIFTLLSLEIWCQEYLDGRFSPEEKNLRLEDYLG